MLLEIEFQKMIPFAPGMTLDKAKEEQPLFAQSIKNDDEVREIVNLSYKLEELQEMLENILEG